MSQVDEECLLYDDEDFKDDKLIDEAGKDRFIVDLLKDWNNASRNEKLEVARLLRCSWCDHDICDTHFECPHCGESGLVLYECMHSKCTYCEGIIEKEYEDGE